MQRKIRIGTRGSPLALAQARQVQQALANQSAVSDEEKDTLFPICVIKTTGDQIQDRPLNAIGGKGLFTKEIEDQLFANEVDIAVHSLKDMPTVLPNGLSLACMLKREDPRDAFLSPNVSKLAELPQGAVVGSTSLRRQAQLLALRPDLKVVTYRGNVETRLRKLKEGEVDATLLAVAGLNRLGLAHEITHALPTNMMVPAAGQGAVTIEACTDNHKVSAVLKYLNHNDTALCVAAERAFLSVLDGSCQTPIGGHAYMEEGVMKFSGRVLSPDGQEDFPIEEAETLASIEEALAFGVRLGQTLRGQIGEEFFERLAVTD